MVINGLSNILKPGGESLIQMPNKHSLMALYHLYRRGFREGEKFDVRYWTRSEIKKTFEQTIGDFELTVDGFFGLGVQPSDIDLMPLKYRMLIRTSELLRYLRVLDAFADSVYVSSKKSG